MVTINNSYFNIRDIAICGQCFRMNQLLDDSWRCVAYDHVVIIKQDNDRITFDCTNDDFKTIWYDYFDLDRDYGKINRFLFEQAKKNNDGFLMNAIDFGRGLRILKQDLWEVIVTFIISQCNRLQRIKISVENLCHYVNSSEDLHFPTPLELSRYLYADLKKSKLGYRIKFITNIAKIVASDILFLSNLKKMNYNDVIKTLVSIDGIGHKVANCIALYGLNILEAFPIDIWMKKIIKKYYNDNFNYIPYIKYAGILQQYMFFYERSLILNKKNKTIIY